MPSKNLSNNVLIVGGLRTAIGNPYKSLKKFTAVQLASIVIDEIVRRYKFKKEWIDEVILGNTVSAGLGQNLSRQAALLANLSENISAYTVNNVCGSGLQSVINGAQSIISKTSNFVLAGGSESATHSPYLVKREEVTEDKLDADLVDSLFHDGLFCQLSHKSMGEIIEVLAKRHRISRRAQDAFSLSSHRRACKAQTDKKFECEIVPIKVTKKVFIVKDDRPRRNINMESLKCLYPAFSAIGSVTAGNSSAPCDAAAIIAVASKDFVRKKRLKPKARLLGYSSIAIDPAHAFEASIVAIKNCLKTCKLGIKDIDLFEVGEAFASQVLITQKELKIPGDKLNIYGGDIAFGHPLGAAGTRILVTLMNALHIENRRRGLVCVAFGGGGSIAMVIEALK